MIQELVSTSDDLQYERNKKSMKLYRNCRTICSNKSKIIISYSPNMLKSRKIQRRDAKERNFEQESINNRLV